MTKKGRGPGKYYREGISLIEAVNRFGDNDKAEKWLVAQRWPKGIRCVNCGDDRIISRSKGRQTPTYHCSWCGRDFTVKTGTIMHGSPLPLQKWAMAFYLYSTHIKSVSSLKLHRDLDITQKSAWHLAHRIRECFEDDLMVFAGPVQVDEVYIGGLQKNKHADKKQHGTKVGDKTAVIGLRDRSGKVIARVLGQVNVWNVFDFIIDTVGPKTEIHTDQSPVYNTLPNPRKSVRHNRGEYVGIDGVTTNGIESFWAMLRRAHKGTFHKWSPKHLHRYIKEFVGRHNIRKMDTIDLMNTLVKRSVGKRLSYRDLIDRHP